MFQTAVFHENIDTAVLDYITAAADPSMRVIGDDILVPGIANLAGAIGVGATLNQVRLESPSLRRRTLLDVEPVNIGAEPTLAGPTGLFHDWFERPIPLVVSEALNAQINQGAGVAERETVVVWFIDALEPVPDGPMFTVRCTNASTLGAYAWTNGALTFTQSLPAGRYALVGARARSAGLIAFRFVVPGGTWRPGGIGCDLCGDGEVGRFRYGQAGVWCEFEHDLPPTADFFSVSADTAQVVHLDLIQIREGAG